MGATTLKRRVGSLLEHNTFVGANREITVVEDVNGLAYELRLHNGVTPGGLRVGSGGSTGIEVTIESFDSSAGSGGDDTVAFRDARALVALMGGTLKLLPNKTYLIDPIDNNTPYEGSNYTIEGSGGSKLKARTSGYAIGTVAVLPLRGNNIVLKNFTLDGNITDDPVNWSTGYNAFQGSRGIVMQDVSGFVIENITAQNTVLAGIAGYRVNHGLIQHCNTNRTRGNFGDGIYMAAANNILVSNCKVYDHTRIGYVLETPTTQTVSTRDVTYINCYAEYGHDASVLYGGIESNFGFWFENFVNAIVINCHSKNQGRTSGGGFKSVPSFWPNHVPSTSNRLYAGAQYINCVAEDCRYGFSIESVQEEMRNMALLENCSALGVQIGLYLGSRVNVVPSYLQQNQVKLINFNVYLDDHNQATRAIMQLGGFVDVDGLFVKYSAGFDQALWDSESDGYSVVGAFGNDTGFKCTLRNAKVFLNDDTEIPLNVKYRSNQTLDNQELEIHNCWVKQVQILCKSVKYFGCTIETLGQEAAKDFLEYNSCIIKGARPDYLGGGRPVTSRASHIKPILFKDCLFDFDTPAPIYLYIFDRVSKEPCIVLDNCVVRRNFEVDGHAFNLNAETALKNNNDEIFNFEFNNCKFVNTGAATTNPIIFTDGVEADRFTALGIGNQKSSTLSVDGNATLLPLYLPVPFGKLKVEPTAITASRNLTSNDFNKTMQNSTSTAIVLTLGANQEALAPIGTEIELTKLGTGNVNFTPTAPSTVNGTTTFAVTTQYSSRKVRKVGSAAWVTV